MGHSRWSPTSYSSYTTEASTKSRSELYHKRGKFDENRGGQAVNIEQIKYRESRDSEKNPNSTPLIIGLDVTGSMGFIPERLTKGALGTMVDGIIQRQPVSDPHFCFVGIGDAIVGDEAPLQATQFEADNSICDQLTDIWLEGGGGGNSYESYDLAWAFAAYKTRTDAWDVRKEKGFLFTIGDELFPSQTAKMFLKDSFTGDCPQAPTPESLLADAQERYHVFHIIITEGSFASRNETRVLNSWRQHLGKRVLELTDYTKVGELITAAIALENGETLDDVLAWFDQSTAHVVEKAFAQ